MFAECEKKIPPENWLHHQSKRLSHKSNNLGITKLRKDQRKIFLVVMNKLLEWMTCDDYRNFKPLRMTVRGAAGTGKTFLIYTIVKVIKHIFSK